MPLSNRLDQPLRILVASKRQRLQLLDRGLGIECLEFRLSINLLRLAGWNVSWISHVRPPVACRERPPASPAISHARAVSVANMQAKTAPAALDCDGAHVPWEKCRFCSDFRTSSKPGAFSFPGGELQTPRKVRRSKDWEAAPSDMKVMQSRTRSGSVGSCPSRKGSPSHFAISAASSSSATANARRCITAFLGSRRIGANFFRVRAFFGKNLSFVPFSEHGQGGALALPELQQFRSAAVHSYAVRLPSCLSSCLSGCSSCLEIHR